MRPSLLDFLNDWTAGCIDVPSAIYAALIAAGIVLVIHVVSKWEV